MTSENYIFTVSNKLYVSLIDDDSIHEVVKFTPGSIQIDDGRVFYNWNPEIENIAMRDPKLYFTTLKEVKLTSFAKLYTSKSWLRKQHLDILINT